MRGLVCWALGASVLALHAVIPVRPVAAESCFGRDLFQWDEHVDYRRALASETIAPRRLTMGGSSVATGSSEADLRRVLGSPFRIAEDWRPRDAEEQCQYLRSVGLANSNSMHYYILEDLNRRRLTGSFLVCEWTLPVGTLRAFLHRPRDSAVARAYLLHLVMNPVAGETVSYAGASANRVVRAGPPRVEWDVARNRVTIRAHSSGSIGR